MAAARIEERLEQIEAEHNVRILYAAESGSRAWGIASPDSDYDVRFIYARPPHEYLRLRPFRDVIELPIEGELDINGWDIYKALNLFRSSNPPLLEWLFSPLIYREPTDFAAALRTLAKTDYSAKRMTYHYLSMAKKNFKDHIEGRQEVAAKKYLYTLRPLFCIRWLEQRGTPAPTALPEILTGITIEPAVLTQFFMLLERKKRLAEMGLILSDVILDAFIFEEIERVLQSVEKLPDPVIEEQALTELIWRTLGVPKP